MKSPSLSAFLAIALAACGGSSSSAVGSGPVLAAAPDAADIFGASPDFALVDQDGAEVTLADFAGRPFAVAAIFTRCAGPCPRITAAMRRLQEELAGTDVALVSVSVDPTHDTPEVLRAYAESYTADTTRWRFLTGSEAAVEAFLKDGLFLALARAQDPEVAPEDAITHSTKLAAIDRHGRLRGWYDGLVPDEVESLRARLVHLAEEG